MALRSYRGINTLLIEISRIGDWRGMVGRAGTLRSSGRPRTFLKRAELTK